ncbi:MAG: ABC transporter ATP-binding protein [Treponema sp.]|nr:ABC transporter ATP-binding protein [Treponema sp.]
MNFLKFNDVHFSYPAVEGDVDEDGKQIQPPVIFDHFSGELPAGFVSLVGPNASGKSTFMLLAAGRVLPQEGTVQLLGRNTRSIDESERDKLASYIYQNMELDTDQEVRELLDYVYKNGSLGGGAAFGALDERKDFLEEVKEVFELQDLLDKKFNALSKGQLQRALAAFSLLYGSKSVFMDEPFFALEERQKESAIKYLKEFCAAKGVTVYISMHELDLTKKYADSVMLFYPNHDIDLGTAEEVLTDQALEKSYGVPASMLKQSEELSREQIARRLNF